MEEKKEFINPIDKDKVTENPGFLPYAHHSGSALIKPDDQGKLKSRALSAMDSQTDIQLTQIYEQMQLLAEQAKKIQARKTISERVYLAEIRFDPIINHVYFLYEKEAGVQLLSLIAPEQWGRSNKNYIFIAEIRLLADHTWDIIRQNQDVEL